MRETLLAVAAILLLAAWTPFPTAVGPEVPLDAPPYIPSSTTSPILASDGHGALMLSVQRWVSRIEERWELYYADRLDENAAPVGESQFLGTVAGASVASSGRGYLVTFLENGEAHAIRFSASGSRIDAMPLSLGKATHIGEVAWDGSAYVVIADQKAFSVAEDGHVLGSRDVPAFTGIETAARNGVTVMVNHGDSVVPPIGPIQMQVIGGHFENLGSGSNTDIAAGDPGFLVVYESGDAIVARHLDPAGDSYGTPFTVAARGSAPAVAWNGTEWVVAYVDDSLLYAVRVLDAKLAQPFVIAPSGVNPALATSGGKVFAVWDSRTGLREEIRSATIEGEHVNDAGPAGRTRAAQSDWRLAAVDGASLVAWYDGRAHVRRMDSTSATQTIPDSGRPVAFAGGRDAALLVTRDPGVLSFTRVGRDGVPLGAQQYRWIDFIDYADAAWIGNQWVVVWRARNGASLSYLYRAIVSADGTLSTPRLFGPAVMTETKGLEVVGMNGKALVLWWVDGTGGGRTSTFTIDDKGVWIAGRDLDQRMLAAASDGTNALTARINGDAVEWQRVTLEGGIPTPGVRGKVTVPEEGMTLQTFFTGENYLLGLGKAEGSPNRIDLYGMRVDVSGAPIDLEPVPFASAFTTLPPLFLGASLRDGATMDLLYARALDEAGLFLPSPRLVFRSVHDSPRRRVVR